MTCANSCHLPKAPYYKGRLLRYSTTYNDQILLILAVKIIKLRIHAHVPVHLLRKKYMYTSMISNEFKLKTACGHLDKATTPRVDPNPDYTMIACIQAHCSSHLMLMLLFRRSERVHVDVLYCTHMHVRLICLFLVSSESIDFQMY